MPVSALWLYMCAGCGGAAGAMLRLWVNRRVFPDWCGGWPCATLAVNIIGCALMGAVCAYVAYAPETQSDARRALVQVGFLGGLTTFSTFVVDIHTLTAGDAAGWGRAMLYVALSVVGGWAAFAGCYTAVR